MYSRQAKSGPTAVPLLLPVMLDLTGKTLLFVGGGKAIAAKLRLLETMRDIGSGFPHVIIVAPAVEDDIRRFVERWHEASYQASFRIDHAPELHERPFQTGDLDGVDILWAYTDDPVLNKAIARAATSRRILASVTGVRGAGGFIQPAILRSEGLPDNLTITVSTSGNDPRLAVSWRDKIANFIREEQYSYSPEDD